MKKFYKVFGSVLICLSSFLGTIKDSTVFAAGTQSTIHYVYSYNTGDDSDNFPYEYVGFSVEFADYTTGTIILTVTNYKYYNYIPIGARLSNVVVTSSSGYMTARFTFQVDDCKQFLILFTPIKLSGSTLTYIPSATVYSNDTSYVDHVNQSFLESQFSTTNGYIDDLESTCSSIYTDVHNIYLQLLSVDSDLDNIQTSLSSIGNYLSTSNSSLSSVNTKLESVLDYLNSISSSNVTIGNELGDVLTVLDSIEDLVGGTLGTNTKLDAIIAELGVLVYQGSDDDAPSLYEIITDVLGVLTNLWDSNVDYTSNLDNITSILESIDNAQVPYSDIDLESLTAWVNLYYFSDHTVNYNGTSPYLISSNTGSGWEIPAGTYYLSFIQDSSNGAPITLTSLSGLTDFTSTRITYTRLSGTYRVITYKFTIGTYGSYSITWNNEGSAITPLYWGNGYNMTTTMQNVTGIESANAITEGLDDANSYLSQILNAIGNISITQTIENMVSQAVELESLTAWNILYNYSTFDVSQTGISGSLVSANTGTGWEIVPGTYYLSFIQNSGNGAPITLNTYTSGVTDFSATRTQYKRLSGTYRIITYKFTIGTYGSYYIQWNNSGSTIIPLYWGDGYLMSDTMKAITGVDLSDDPTYSLDTDSFDDILTDYNNSTNDIFDQFNDSTSQLDLTDDNFSISSDVLSAFNFISTNVQALVTQNSSISILFYLPVLLGIAFIFLGMRRDK